MRVCSKCGAVGDGLVCEYCRAPFTDDAPEATGATFNYNYAPAPVFVAPPPVPVPQPAFFPPPQMVSNKNWWATLLLCFFVVLRGDV
jgi:hypothetical protein